MKNRHRQDEPARRTRRSAGKVRRPQPPYRPAHRHPLVAASLILIVACGVQVGLWLAKAHLDNKSTPPKPVSALMMHPYPYTVLIELYSGQNSGSETAGPPQFETGAGLGIALLSTMAIFAGVHLALGPAWALGAALSLVIHPGFSFLIANSGLSSLVTALVPALWALGIWWARSRRLGLALLLGVLLGVLSMLNWLGYLLLLIVVPHVFFSGQPGSKRWAGTILLLAGYAAVICPAFYTYRHHPARRIFEQNISKDLWTAIDNGDGTYIAKAARGQQSKDPAWPRPWLFLAQQVKTAPHQVALWWLQRLWRTLYATAELGQQQILLAAQLLWLIPAPWGFIVAVRDRGRRGIALTAAGFFVLQWAFAALVDPLARNLTPVLGLGIMLAMLGLADLYQRVAGPALEQPQE